LNGKRLGDKLAQGIAANGISISANQKELLAPFAVTKIGGIPPLRQRAAQSRCTFPWPGFITPK